MNMQENIDSSLRVAIALVPVEKAAREAVRVMDMSTREYANLRDAIDQLDRVMKNENS